MSARLLPSPPTRRASPSPHQTTLITPPHSSSHTLIIPPKTTPKSNQVDKAPTESYADVGGLEQQVGCNISIYRGCDHAVETMNNIHLQQLTAQRPLSLSTARSLCNPKRISHYVIALYVIALRSRRSRRPWSCR
jgi:hypothetical protein